MLSPAKKKAMISIIIGKSEKKKPEEDSSMSKYDSMPDPIEEGEEDGDMGLKSCAESLIQAVHSKNESGVVEALKSFFDIYDGGSDEEEE